MPIGYTRQNDFLHDFLRKLTCSVAQARAKERKSAIVLPTPVFLALESIGCRLATWVATGQSMAL